MPGRRCAWCAIRLVKPHTGRPGRFCSALCRSRWHYHSGTGAESARRRYQAKLRPALPALFRRCMWCAVKYEAKRTGKPQRCCSKRCYYAWKNDVDREVLAAYAKRWHAANREAIAKRNREWRQANPEARRERERRYRAANPQAHAENLRRKRARRHGALVERFRDVEVYERDGWVCQLCLEPVDRALRWPDPLSVSLDHIVPLSKGGAHSRANVQCAHLGCNSRKGNRVEVA